MSSEPLDFVTVLTTRGPLATKQISHVPGQNEPCIQSYGRAAWFSLSVHGTSSIDELASLLGQLERQPRSFIVRGRPKPGVDHRMARRRVRDRRNADGTASPATLEPASRHWIGVDCDRIPCPDRIDPVFDPDWVVEHVVSYLPIEFHDATCFWQFTSSHGIKPGISLRLFFWSKRPLADWELRIWFAGSPVDHSVFAPAQPIYVAWPIFNGMADPLPVRSGIWRGDRDVIIPPSISPQARIAVATKAFPRAPGIGYRFHRGRIGDHEGGAGFYEPVKAAVASWFGQHGSLTGRAWLRADLERAIRDAWRDPGKHDDAYVEFRVADLDTLVAAIAGLQAAKEKKLRQLEECEPTYTAPLGSVEAARDLLARIFDAHVAAMSAYARSYKAYARAVKEWEARQAA
jgi:hypothetical protein